MGGDRPQIAPAALTTPRRRGERAPDTAARPTAIPGPTSGSIASHCLGWYTDRRRMVDGERADTIVVLTGDVMTGRGIDQILPCASGPELHEAYVRDARVYVELADAVNGPIPRCVDPGYIWG